MRYAETDGQNRLYANEFVAASCFRLTFLIAFLFDVSYATIIMYSIPLSSFAVCICYFDFTMPKLEISTAIQA